MLDIALDSKSHDIVIDGDDIVFIDNAERVAQQIKIQLLTFLGEWFLDTTHGVPYLEYVLIKNPNFTLIRQLFWEEILKVDDVKNIDSLELEYDSKARTITVEFSVSTNYGMITRKEVLGYVR